MEFTIKERISILDTAIYRLVNGRDVYMCYALEHAIDINLGYSSYEDPFKYFPELFDYKPFWVNTYERWWHPRRTKKRIRVLKRVRKKLTKQL